MAGLGYAFRRFIGPAAGAAGLAALNYGRGLWGSRGGYKSARFTKAFTGRRKSMFKRKRGKQYTSAKDTVSIRSGVHRPLPIKMELNVDTENAGYWATGSAQTNTFLVKLNSVILPFNTATPINNPLGAVNVLMPGALTSLLNANVYQRFIVRKCTIRVEIQPNTGGDSIFAVVVPYDGNATSHAAWGSYIAAAAAPESVETLCQLGVKNTLRKTITPEAVMSRTTLQYTDDNLSWGTYAADPANICYWQIIYQTGDQATLAANLVVRVNCYYQVELFQGLSSGEEKDT